MSSSLIERSARWAIQAARFIDAGVVIHAADTSVLWCNQTATEMLGLSLDENLSALLTLVHLGDRAILEAAYEVCAPSQSPRAHRRRRRVGGDGPQALFRA